jgi:hypothetical protein
VIAHSVELGGIDDHCCLDVIVRFVDLGGTITSKQQWS